MKQLKTRLILNEIRSIGFVDKGACPGADILVIKRDDNANKAEWTAAFINDLPDSSFAVVESGGEKDDRGKTVPRSLRHLPFRDASGKIDLPHLRNALARLPQSKLSAELKAKAQRKLTAAAREAGVGEAEKLAKVGRKISSQRMRRLQKVMEELSAIIAEQAKEESGMAKQDQTQVDLSGVELSDEQREQINSAVKQAVESAISKKDEEIAALKSDLEAAKADKDQTEDVLKSLPDDLRKRFEENERRAKEAEEVAKAERDTRLAAEWVAKAAKLDALPLKAEEFGPVLKRIADVIGAEDLTELQRVLSAADESVRKSKLFESVGRENNDSSALSASERLDKMARELVEQKKAASYGEAVAQIAKTETGLYAEYRREQIRH